MNVQDFVNILSATMPIICCWQSVIERYVVEPVLHRWNYNNNFIEYENNC